MLDIVTPRLTLKETADSLLREYNSAANEHTKDERHNDISSLLQGLSLLDPNATSDSPHHQRDLDALHVWGKTYVAVAGDAIVHSDVRTLSFLGNRLVNAASHHPLVAHEALAVFHGVASRVVASAWHCVQEIQPFASLENTERAYVALVQAAAKAKGTVGDHPASATYLQEIADGAKDRVVKVRQSPLSKVPTLRAWALMAGAVAFREHDVSLLLPLSDFVSGNKAFLKANPRVAVEIAAAYLRQEFALGRQGKLADTSGLRENLLPQMEPKFIAEAYAAATAPIPPKPGAASKRFAESLTPT